MRLSLALFTALILASPAASQSYSHNYESFFGKEDRIGLYSQAAAERFTPAILKTLQNNTLLMDCGVSGKPSTAFVIKTKQGSRIISAAHNLTMARLNKRECKLSETVLPDGHASKHFKDNGTLSDAAFDIAQWPNITPHLGFDICQAVNTKSDYILVQSLDGTGRLGVSPTCKITSVEDELITTTCRGHYKASGAPLLAVKGDSICALGVFNAHSGRLFNYQSYAARLKP